MNRNHSRKTQFSSVKAALAAALLATCAISIAHAQDAMLTQQEELVLPGATSLESAAPEFKLPEGATVGDANEKIKKLSSDGAKSLQELVGSAVDNARENADVEARSADKREINALTVQVEKAKLAKQLYQIINGEEDQSKQELETVKVERDELSNQVKSLEEQLAESNKKIQGQSIGGQEPIPVIVSIFGAGDSLSAKLLVPYYGEAIVRKGDVLANGQTVSAITANGVTVSKQGDVFKLAFGTSVPASPR